MRSTISPGRSTSTACATAAGSCPMTATRRPGRRGATDGHRPAELVPSVPRPRREVPRPDRPRRLRRSRAPCPAADVLEALRAWSAEVGRPPRTYDWSPRASRRAGFPLGGVEKWEREDPRWTHHTLVRARLGAWPAAPGAACLPAAPPLRIERRERVAIAQRLEGGLPAAEIAELIGVLPRTVRRYWTASVCSRCGGPQVCPDARSCADCVPYEVQRRPSRR